MNWPALFDRVPDDPYYEPRRPLWLPREMKEAQRLDPGAMSGPMEPGYALLLNPFYAKSPHGSFGKHVLTPTLALTSIAGATPAGWRVRYWDENLLQGPPPLFPLPQVVGITVHLTFAKRAYELAAWYRARGCKIVFGGLHVQSCPDEVRPYADALAIGEGTQLWPEILRDVAAGCLKPRYEASYERAYDLDPAPRRELLDRRSFLTTTSLNATRGCHNRCGFCYLSTEGLKMPYRMRDPEDVRRQWELDGQPYAVFTDNNLGSRKDYLRQLCRALRPVKGIWSAAVTLDVSDDPALVREMALSGCTGVFIGFESLSDDNLAGARKRTPKAEDYARRVGIFRDHGIQVNGSFVVGFDGDRRDTFTTLAQWIEGNRMECATFHILTPYPGTPLFRQLEAEGRLLHRDWDKYDTAHVVFQPKHLTPEELLLGYDWLYRRLFSHASIWRRRPESWSALPMYFAGCYLYKRSNRLWRFLIKRRLVHAAWRPLVEVSRLRHLAYRKQLERGVQPIHESCGEQAASIPFPASV
ncbi:MAG: radical SAM protein [Verrucomicrobiota bacterium]